MQSVTRQLLDLCASVLAQESPGPVKLENAISLIAVLGRELREKRIACIEHLAQKVFALTNGRKTVREVREQLLADAPMGVSKLFVVVCDADTPQGQVINPVDGMMPYVISVADDFMGLRLTFKPTSSKLT